MEIDPLEILVISMVIVLALFVLRVMLRKEKDSEKRRHTVWDGTSDSEPSIGEPEGGVNFGIQPPDRRTYWGGALVGLMAGVPSNNDPIPGARYYVQVQTSEDDRRLERERLTDEAIARLDQRFGGPIINHQPLNTIYLTDPDFTPDIDHPGWGWQILKPAPPESMRHAPNPSGAEFSWGEPNNFIPRSGMVRDRSTGNWIYPGENRD